ncbi:unnamed protein product [Owenia fusiformis]|uniref:Uncharacterized protein n=1 Tax=Owenia fusiformis TaxID=6347 RepID=A0A8J1TAZ6_OWEFU|nr:unnamed protein product [Owenia fusiformis]
MVVEMDPTRIGHVDKESKWQILKGLPLHHDHLALEIEVICKLIYSSMVEHNNESLEDVIQKLIFTLNRVKGRSLPVQQLHGGTCIEQTLNEVTTLLITLLADIQSQEMLKRLVKVGLIFVVVQGKQKFHTDPLLLKMLFKTACAIVKSGSKNDELVNDNPKEVLLIVCNSQNIQSDSDVRDVICLLYGSYLMSNPTLRDPILGDTTLSGIIEVLDVISTETLLPLAKYFKALCNIMHSDISNAMRQLEHVLKSNMTRVKLQAFSYNALGVCFHLQGKHHTAIQKFKEAMHCDGSLYIALLNLSVQYRCLGLQDPELEMLHILIGLLESDTEMAKWNTMDCHTNKAFIELDDILLEREELSPTVTLPEVLYYMAKQCLQLQKYKHAGEQYLKLLNHLVHNKQAKNDDKPSAIYIPSIHRLFHETAHSLLLAKDYESCIMICRQAISKYTPQRQNKSHTSNRSEHTKITQSAGIDIPCESQNLVNCDKPMKNNSNVNKSDISRKRLHSNSVGENANLIDDENDSELHPGIPAHILALVSHEKDNDTDVKFSHLKDDVISLMYLTEALVQQGSFESALEAISSVLSTIEDIKGSGETHKQYGKRKKEEQDADSSKIFAQPYYASTIQSLKGHAYFLKGITLFKLSKHQDSLHFFMMSSLFSPDPVRMYATYHHSVCLAALGKPRVGYTNWRDIRGLNNHNVYQIQELKAKLSRCSKSDQSGLSRVGYCTELEMLQLDVDALTK